MKTYHPVTLASRAFLFCKWSMAVLVWASVLSQSEMLLAFSCGIFLLSALVGVERSPFILFYTHTLEKLFPGPQEMVDRKALRFAHYFAMCFSLVSLLFIYFGMAKVGWTVAVLLGIAKVSGALGYCGAAKLYGCMSGGSQCCRTSSRIKAKCNVG